METSSEYLEESCWEDGECSNECEQCNNITDRCCISCDGRIGCLYLCQMAKLQQEHERKSDDELIKLFEDWSEEDIRYLYAEDRIRRMQKQIRTYEQAITDVCKAINKVKCNINYPKRKELCLELNKLCRLLRESHDQRGKATLEQFQRLEQNHREFGD